MINGNLDVVEDKGKGKAHDLLEATYIPQILIDVQRELMHPYHNGLFIRMVTKYPDEFKSLDSPEAFLTLLCTDLEIELDGEYTLEDLASKVYKRINSERRLNDLTIYN